MTVTTATAAGEEVGEEVLSRLLTVQRRALARAETWVDEVRRGERSEAICGAVLLKDCRMGKAGERCRNRAGLNTPNAGDAEEPGVGPCWVHGGAKMRGRAEAGWIMSHRFAQQLNVSPWDGLLSAVRIAAGKVAYTEWVLSQARDDLELEGRFGKSEEGILLHPDTGEPLGGGQLRNLGWWVRKNELWVDRLARYSKAAIDAGVAERLVEIEQTRAEQVARVLNGVVDAMESSGADDDTLIALRSAMRTQLLSLEAAERSSEGDSVVVNGGAP